MVKKTKKSKRVKKSRFVTARGLDLGRRKSIGEQTARTIKRAFGIARKPAGRHARKASVYMDIDRERMSWVQRTEYKRPLATREVSKLELQRPRFPPPPRITTILKRLKFYRPKFEKIDKRWIPPRSIIKMKLSPKGTVAMSRLKKLAPKHYQMLLHNLSKRMNKLHDEVFKAWLKTEKYIPKDTNALRTAFGASLSSDVSVLPPAFPTHHNQIKLEIGWGADLPYLKYLHDAKNEMVLAHFGVRKSWRTGLPLLDPYAEKGFLNYKKSKPWRAMMDAARKEAGEIMWWYAIESQFFYGRNLSNNFGRMKVREHFTITNIIEKRGIKNIPIAPYGYKNEQKKEV